MKQSLKMKLIVLTCIVASALAAPADRTARDILPGDLRYDATHHQQHAQHERHENEVEISKALGGYAGTFSGPDINFGFSGLETGDFFGDTEFLKYNIDADRATVNSDGIKISGSKAFERLTSIPEESSASPKIESATVDKSSYIAGSDVATSTDFTELVSQTTNDDVNEESSETADKTKLRSKSASEDTSSDASKAAKTKSATFNAKTSAKAISDVVSLGTDSLTPPFFDSAFDSGFSSFEQTGYNPSLHSLGGYTPEFSSFNINNGFYNNYGDQPLSLDSYSGFGKEIKDPTINFNSPVEFSPLSPLDFTKSIPYLAPSSFSSFQPDIKITHSAYTSGSQLTDANGGYVY